jgi:hypothetical protein
MQKFKIYRAISFITLVLSFATMLFPFWLPENNFDVIRIIAMIAGVLIFVCYALLVSVLNFYNEPLWKKFAIWFFIIGFIFFNSFLVLVVVRYTAIKFISFFLLLFYLPFIAAFVTIKHKGISALAQSFAYTLLIACLMRLAIPFVRNLISLSRYSEVLNIVVRLPLVFIVLIFHKMIGISKNDSDETSQGEDDLL